MKRDAFRTAAGNAVPAVTATEMRAIDRVAVEEIGLSLLMMMEHAGRGLAAAIQARSPEGRITVLAGGGGNGGGGLCAARHLANHGRAVDVVRDRPVDRLADAPTRQWQVLGDAATDRTDQAADAVEAASLVIDALVGYSLQGAPRDRLARLIELASEQAATVVSLDVPSGVAATTGETPGPAVRPELTVTLALPKTGLERLDTDLELLDLGIPSRAFEQAGVPYESPFRGEGFRVPLRRHR